MATGSERRLCIDGEPHHQSRSAVVVDPFLNPVRARSPTTQSRIRIVAGREPVGELRGRRQLFAQKAPQAEGILAGHGGLKIAQRQHFAVATQRSYPDHVHIGAVVRVLEDFRNLDRHSLTRQVQLLRKRQVCFPINRVRIEEAVHASNDNEGLSSLDPTRLNGEIELATA